MGIVCSDMVDVTVSWIRYLKYPTKRTNYQNGLSSLGWRRLWPVVRKADKIEFKLIEIRRTYTQQISLRPI